MTNAPHELIKAFMHIERLLLIVPVVIVPKKELARDFGLMPGFEVGFLELREPPFPRRFEFLNHGDTFEFMRLEVVFFLRTSPGLPA